MTEFVENFLCIDFHQVNVLHEEPKVAIKCRSVDGVDHRHEGAPVFVKELDGLLLELANEQLVHEPCLIHGFLPASITLLCQFGDELRGLRLVQLQHETAPSKLHYCGKHRHPYCRPRQLSSSLPRLAEDKRATIQSSPATLRR